LQALEEIKDVGLYTLYRVYLNEEENTKWESLLSASMRTMRRVHLPI
jgi:hypothetical protein